MPYERDGIYLPIENYKLEENRPLGVSNQFVNANPVISVGKGSLLIVY